MALPTRVSQSLQYLTPWRLTPAEVRALDCACLYGRDKQIARHLGVSKRTVETHLQSAYYKMGVNGPGAAPRVLALRLWLQHHGAIVL